MKEKKMKLPNIDLKELEKHKEEILKERIKMSKIYEEWLKKNSKVSGRKDFQRK